MRPGKTSKKADDPPTIVTGAPKVVPTGGTGTDTGGDAPGEPDADEDLARDLYDLTQAICTDAGLPAYEISNHARPGAECR